MPLYAGPWQPPPPRQQVTERFPGDLEFHGGFGQYQAADPGSSTVWADLLDLPIDNSPLSSAALEIEHFYDPAGYLGLELDQWRLDQGNVNLTPQLRTPVGGWSPPLPWPAGAVDWEFDPAANPDNAVYDLIHQDLKLSATFRLYDGLDAAGYAGRGETPYLTDLIVAPVDPATLTLDYGTSGQEPRPQNVRQAELLAWPVIGRGSLPVGGTVDIVTSTIDVATYLACLDVISGAAAVVRFTVNFDNMRAGTEPGRLTYREPIFDYVDYTSDWQPPRWRFLFDARPPLAHRQRRDGTATAGPQLAHVGTAGGRPPLAWRQHTP